MIVFIVVDLHNFLNSLDFRCNRACFYLEVKPDSNTSISTSNYISLKFLSKGGFKEIKNISQWCSY